MKRKHKPKKTSDAVAILDRMAGESSQMRHLMDEARVNAAFAQLIHEARTRAGLSQAQLAERIGSKQSVISRLEDADYEGHSLTMLHRIAAALGQCVEIRFLDPARATRARKMNSGRRRKRVAPFFLRRVQDKLGRRLAPRGLGMPNFAQ